MKKIVVLCLFAMTLLASQWRQSNILASDRVITIYQNRLNCLKTQEAIVCIQRFPQDPRSDALAQTFAMSFPKAFYANKLQRDIDLLKRQKLCYGKALTQEEAKKCIIDLR